MRARRSRDTAQAGTSWLLLAALTAGCLLKAATGSVDATALRGASPALADQYQKAQRSGTFTCRDGSATFSASRLNDDFCDCPDGSDEPGTSACPNGTFYCKNRGHEPKALHSGFVDDGVCDCCDGSDEGRGTCPNKCLASAEAEMEALEQQVAGFAEGLRKRDEYIIKAREVRSGWVDRMDALDDQVEIAKKALDELKVQKDAVEAEEHKVREQERIEREAREAEEAARREAEGVKEDEGQAGAAGAEGEGKDEDSYPGDDPEDAYEGTPEYDYEDLAEESDGEEDPDEVGRRIASRWTSDPEAAGEHAEDDYHDGDYYNANADYSDTEYAPSADGAADGSTEPESMSEGDRIRAEFRQAESNHRNLMDEHTDLVTKINMDLGHQHVWATLWGTCVSAKVDKYTYEVCIGGDAKQKEGHGSTSLGSWKGGWAEGRLVYQDGAACWQGPRRSMNVSLQCGSAEELVNVEEPSRCEYTAVLRTPAACHEDHVSHTKAKLEGLREMIKQVHDEL